MSFVYLFMNLQFDHRLVFCISVLFVMVVLSFVTWESSFRREIQLVLVISIRYWFYNFCNLTIFVSNMVVIVLLKQLNFLGHFYILSSIIGCILVHYHLGVVTLLRVSSLFAFARGPRVCNTKLWLVGLVV